MTRHPTRLSCRWAMLMVLMLVLTIPVYAFAREVTVSIPDLSAEPGSSISVPVNIDDATGIYSGEVDLAYDSSVLSATGVSTNGTVAQGRMVTPNLTVSGRVRVAMAGASPMSGGGVLVYVDFAVIGAPLSSSDFTLQSISFDEGSFPASAQNGSLEVIGQALTVNLIPPELEFGGVEIGQDMALPVVIENMGPEALMITSLSTGTVHYDLPAAPITATIPPSGGVLELSVLFAPLDAGLLVDALTIGTDLPGTPLLTVPLSGLGVPSGMAGTIGTIPPELAFPPVEVGQDLIKTLGIFNFSPAELMVTFLNATTVDYDLPSVPITPVTLQPWQNVPLPVRFAPQAVGPRPGNLHIGTNDPGNPVVIVPLLGEGLPPGGAALTLTIPHETVPRFGDIHLPVIASDMTGLGTLSGFLRILYDPSVVVLGPGGVVQGDVLPTTAHGASPSLSIAYHTGPVGGPLGLEGGGMNWLNIAFAGADSLVGAGDLVRIHFQAVGAEGAVTPVPFDSVAFDEDGLVALTVDGSLTIGPGGVPEVVVRVPNAAVDDTVLAMSLPVLVERDVTGLGIYSAEMRLSYDSDVVLVQDVRGGISEAGSLQVGAADADTNVWVEYNDVEVAPGQREVSIALATTQAWSGQGPLVFLDLSILGAAGDTAEVAFEYFMFNEGVPAAQTVDGSVAIDPTVPQPDIKASVNSLDFGAIMVGTSMDTTITISNDGNDTLIVSQIVPPDPPFGIPDVIGLEEISSPDTLVPGESREVRVVFAPQAVAVYQDTLRISSNDPDTPNLDIPLMGEGTPAPEIQACALNFASVLLGQSANVSLLIDNEGLGPLLVTGIASDNPDFTLGALPAEIAAGANGQIMVTFTPGAEGVIPGTLTIASNDPANPLAPVSVVGRGVNGAGMGPDATIYSGLVTVEGAVAPIGTVLEAYHPGTGAFVFSTRIVAENAGTNYAMQVLEGLGGIAGGDQPMFRGVLAEDCATFSDPPLTGNVLAGDPTFVAAFPPQNSPGLDIDLTRGADLVIPLVQGYNAVSWNVAPENDSVEVVFGDLLATGKVSILLDYLNDGAGTEFFNYYIPGLGESNPFQRTEAGKGYFVQLNPGVEPETLRVSGPYLDPQMPLPLVQGYNLLAYLPDGPDSLVHALGSVDFGKMTIALDYVNDGAGTEFFDYYIPGLGESNPFQCMWPTKGYFIQLGPGQSDTLVYPSTQVGCGVGIAAAKRAYGYGDVKGSIMAMVLYGTEATVDGALISEGAEIRAVGVDGVLCGKAEAMAPGVFGIVVYGDDPYTSADEGPVPGEKVALFVDGVRLDEEVIWTRFGDVHRLEELHFAGMMAGADVPETFDLEQNRPNPFNPSTLIGYQLPEPARVLLTVYNLLGQEIMTLVDKHQSPGYYTVGWNGKDRYGNEVADGVYLYRIEAGRFRAMKKMVMLK